MYEIGFNDVPWFPNRAVQVGFTVGYLVTMPLISLMLFSRFPLIRTLREIYGVSFPTHITFPCICS